MEASGLSRIASQHDNSLTDSTLTPLSGASTKTLKQQAMEDSIDPNDSEIPIEANDSEDPVESDDSEELIKDEYVLEQDKLVKLTFRAPLPTNPGYYIDLMLGRAASNPHATPLFREMCLSAQKARTLNEIPRETDHWDFVLAEAKIIRNEMRQRRKAVLSMAAQAAEDARWGWDQRKECRRGNPQAWVRFLRTTADVMNVTAEEVAEDVRDAARWAAAQQIDIPKIVVTAATPSNFEKTEEVAGDSRDVMRSAVAQQINIPKIVVTAATPINLEKTD